jgi:hypothetical protein
MPGCPCVAGNHFRHRPECPLYTPMSDKPRKRDYADKMEFLRASAAWAEDNMGEWPWDNSRDEDDDYVYVRITKPRL